MSEPIIADEFKVIGPLVKGRSAQINKGISLKNGNMFAIKLQLRDKSDSVLR
jgi:hypothetical protein